MDMRRKKRSLFSGDRTWGALCNIKLISVSDLHKIIGDNVTSDIKKSFDYNGTDQQFMHYIRSLPKNTICKKISRHFNQIITQLPKIPKEVVDKVYQFTENKFYYKRMIELSKNRAILTYSSYMDYKRAWSLLLNEIKRKDLKHFLKSRKINFNDYVTRLVENAEDWLIDYDEDMVLTSLAEGDINIGDSTLSFKPPGHQYYYDLDLLIPLHVLKIALYDIQIFITKHLYADDAASLNTIEYKYNRLPLSQLIRIFHKLCDPIILLDWGRDSNVKIYSRGERYYYKHVFLLTRTKQPWYFGPGYSGP
jgi:hypothetical protein